MVSPNVVITEQLFRKLLQHRLNDLWERCRTIFRNFGPHLRYKVLSVFTHAADQGKLSQVVSILEAHYQGYLQHQPWQVRGTFVGPNMVNPTEEMFLAISNDILRGVQL